MLNADRIWEASKVFAIFGICGFLATCFLEPFTGTSFGFPFKLLPFATFGISGSLTWLTVCRRSSELWPVAGVLAGVFNPPLLFLSELVIAAALLNFPDPTPADVLQGLAFLPIALLAYFPFSLLAGWAGAFLCRKLVKPMSPVSPPSGN